MTAAGICSAVVLLIGPVAAPALAQEDKPAASSDGQLDTADDSTSDTDDDQGTETDPSASGDTQPDPAADAHWISHHPPPVDRPQPIDSDEQWNAFDFKHTSLVISAGLLLDRAHWLSQNDASREQPGVGDLSDYDGGTIRALRFGLNGDIKFRRPWHYSIWFATNAFDQEFDPDDVDNISFFDYRLDVPIGQRTTFSVGKQKEPISLPRLMTLTWNPIQERTTAENAFMPSRNIGLVLSGNGLDQRMSWATGVFNNWVDSGESFSDNANQAVGRATGLPMVSEDESNLFHLGLGFRYDDAKQGLRYAAVPEVRDAPFLVDTGQFDADSAFLINLEASWRRKALWILGELSRNEVDAPLLGNPTFNGYHLLASWTVTGEMRPYNRKSGVFGTLPVARDIYHGGFGAVELALRWSVIDLTDAAIEGGEMQVAKAAATWWLSTHLNVSLNYQSIWNEVGETKGRADGIVVRLMIFTP